MEAATAAIYLSFDQRIAAFAGRRAAGPVEPLTSREVEVLALICCAASNREIADRLEISPRTVECHLSHIYDKLGVRGRGEAMLWAVHHSLSLSNGSTATNEERIPA